MSERRIEKTVKILVEFEDWEIEELASHFKGDMYSLMGRKYGDLFESVLADEVQG